MVKNDVVTLTVLTHSSQPLQKPLPVNVTYQAWHMSKRGDMQTLSRGAMGLFDAFVQIKKRRMV